jgi:hypothetical protein
VLCTNYSTHSALNPKQNVFQWRWHVTKSTWREIPPAGLKTYLAIWTHLTKQRLFNAEHVTLRTAY